MVEASSDNVEAHFNGHETAGRRCLALLKDKIYLAALDLAQGLYRGHKVLAFGNGGSASQASHFAGELLGRYAPGPRRGLAAVALASDASVTTCIANDFDFASIFERQMEALAQPGDLAVGFTTSGKSPNVLRALAAAERNGAVTLALTGAAGLDGGCARHTLAVPSTSTAHIQEMHLVILHIWCEIIERTGASRST